MSPLAGWLVGLSEKRLLRTKAAEARVEELLGDLEELKEMLEEAQSAKQSPALRAANLSWTCKV